MARPRKNVDVNDSAKKCDIDSVVADFDEKMENGVGFKKSFSKDDLIPAGCTLVNLAMSDTAYGGWSKGKINTFPGGSSSGKSYCVLTSMAEVANNPEYDDYEIIYDDVEAAAEFNIENLFGNKLKERLKAPKYDSEGAPIYSNTIQEFRNNILKRTSEKTPFIWVLDSWDALASDEEVEKNYKEALKAAKSAEHVKELSSGYKTEKSKIGGEILRMIKREMKDSGSLLIIIQQTRQNINAGLFGKKEITSGGNSPFFYSTHQLWANKIKTLKDPTTNRIIGQRVKIDVTKNKLTGKKRSVEFELFDSYGIDNIGSCIDFLVNEGHWKKSGQTIKAVELGIEAVRKKLIDEIEEIGLEGELIKVTEKVWNNIEESIIIKRKPKYN